DPAWPPHRSGFAPDDPALALATNAHARPFADLSRFDKSEIVHDFIPWEFYHEHGLHPRDQLIIEHNVIQGNPADQWLQSTSPAAHSPAPAAAAGQQAGMIDSLRDQLFAPNPQHNPAKDSPPFVDELLKDIHKLTTDQFVYDSRWGGPVPAPDVL